MTESDLKSATSRMDAGPAVEPGEEKTLLRFLTCGSVDDGKSTLIGRLLYDSQLLLDDQLAGLESDSRQFGTAGTGRLDFALLVDGLAAEREQGITIDVAYRYFATPRRKFIVADTPGHEQYTRNMVTGASTAELAVLLVDARNGVLTQTRRHAYIASLLGIRHIVLAVNKMDRVAWDRQTFERIASEFEEFARSLDVPQVVSIPLSALQGDNVTSGSSKMSWYKGPTLLHHLESVDLGGSPARPAFRMPVQWVNRPNGEFRGYSGTAVGGSVERGQDVVVLPSARTTQVARIVTEAGDLDRAAPGQAVTLVLSDPIDVSRGDWIAATQGRPEVADQFRAHIVWLSERALLPGRAYLLQTGTCSVGAQVTEIRYKVNVNTLEHTAAKHLDLNEVAVCNLALDRRIPFDVYADVPETGGFILIDRLTHDTLGCGMIDFPLRRAANLHWQSFKIDRQARAAAGEQRPCVLWFTGLSGAGKSTVADQVERALYAMGKRTMLLDGDNLRHGLSRDLGFTDEDRVENIRRTAEVAKLMVDAGLITLVSLISPFQREREMARDRIGEAEFLEIFVDAPLEVCERRDPKGLYKKARAGALPNFTGIDSPYEAPKAPALRLAADSKDPEALAAEVVALLRTRGIV